jgi:tRNA(Leu) C34 or U34 (ribose-2'-O)-methylase TrmL
VEVDGADIRNFKHPQRAVYVFGGEDRTLPKITEKRLRIETSYCLNMATAASIAMFYRSLSLET